MIYSGENPIIELINAEALRWNSGSFDVKPRKVSALAFRVKGTADMVCAGKRFFVDAGDVLYMPQGLGYQVEYGETQMYVIHFVTRYDDSGPEVYHLKNRTAVHQLMMQAVDMWEKKEPGYSNFCMGILHQIFGQLCTQKMQEQIPASFHKAVDFLHQNFTQPLTMTALCQAVSISSTALRQNFSHYYGTTPTQYLRRLRLEYGRNLIAGGMVVEKAAQVCGIGDPKYFARLVKQEYGCTPRQLKLYGK